MPAIGRCLSNTLDKPLPKDQSSRSAMPHTNRSWLMLPIKDVTSCFCGLGHHLVLLRLHPQDVQSNQQYELEAKASGGGAAGGAGAAPAAAEKDLISLDDFSEALPMPPPVLASGAQSAGPVGECTMVVVYVVRSAGSDRIRSCGSWGAFGQRGSSAGHWDRRGARGARPAWAGGGSAGGSWDDCAQDGSERWYCRALQRTEAVVRACGGWDPMAEVQSRRRAVRTREGGGCAVGLSGRL